MYTSFFSIVTNSVRIWILLGVSFLVLLLFLQAESQCQMPFLVEDTLLDLEQTNIH